MLVESRTDGVTRSKKAAFLAGFCALLLALPSGAFAAVEAGWYNGLTFSYLYSGTTGDRTGFQVTNTIPGNTCPGNEFDFSVTSAQFTQIWSIVLLAYAQGLNISVYTDGTCTSYGLNGTDVRLGTPIS